jgi:hypothetical protein
VYKQANSKSAPAKLFLMGYIVTAACVIRTQSKQASKRPTTTLLLNGQLLLLLVPLQIIAFRAQQRQLARDGIHQILSRPSLTNELANGKIF